MYCKVSQKISVKPCDGCVLNPDNTVDRRQGITFGSCHAQDEGSLMEFHLVIMSVRVLNIYVHVKTRSLINWEITPFLLGNDFARSMQACLNRHISNI